MQAESVCIADGEGLLSVFNDETPSFVVMFNGAAQLLQII